MSNLFLLIKLGMQDQFRLAELKNRKNKSKRRNTILLSITFVILGLFIALYAAGSAYGLYYMKLENMISPVALTATALITFFFTMLKTNGILFGYHNYDMLASLPVKMNTLVASRFMQLYLPNLLFGSLIMLPMGIVYGICCNMGPLFYIYWMLSIPFSPLVPTTLAAIVGVLIMSIASRMRHPQTVSAILSVILIVGILVGTSFLGSSTENLDLSVIDPVKMAYLSVSLEKVLFSLYPVSFLFQQATIQAGLIALLYFVLFVGGSYLWYIVFVKITGHFYVRLQSALTAHHSKHGAKELQKVGIYTQKTPLMAVYRKEWKRFLSSNIYLMNMGVGSIMVILMSLALTFVPEDKITALFQANGVTAETSVIAIISTIAPFLIAGLLGMSCTACCSLSLEGKYIETLRSLPIKPVTLYEGKMLMNLSLLAPVSIICSTVISLKYGSGIIQKLLIFFVPLAFACFTSVWGMFINIHFVNYSWENETTIVKQSASSFFGLFGGLVLAGICVGIILNIPTAAQMAVTAIIGVVILLITLLLYNSVSKSGIPEGK